ncbi:MAG: hypothetical protein V3U76_12255 [Granulosicoccus sp.]
MTNDQIKPGDTLSDTHESDSWVVELASAMRQTDRRAEARIRTTLNCSMSDGRPTLYVPPEMASLQPQSLRYLQSFARAQNFRMIEDRRRMKIRPVIEQRSKRPPAWVRGIGELLRQTGLPGLTRTMSEPHRLAADSPHISVQDLIEMAAYAAPRSKRVVILPNRSVSTTLGNNTQPITGFACKLLSAGATTVLSHFNSDSFRSIGYSTGKQYVMHVFLAGGSLPESQLWTSLQALSQTNFRFHLYRNPNPTRNFGLFYNTFYLDLESGMNPWWIESTPQLPLDSHKSAIG